MLRVKKILRQGWICVTDEQTNTGQRKSKVPDLVIPSIAPLARLETSGAGGAIGKFSEQKEAAVTSKRRTQGSQYDQLTIQDTQRIVLYRSLNQNRPG